MPSEYASPFIHVIYSQKAVRTPGSEDNRHYPVLFQLWLVRIPGGSVQQYGFLYYKRSGGTAINPVIFTIIGGLAMSLTAIMGFKAIKKLSEIGLPLLFVLCIVAVWKTAGIIPMSSILEAGPVGEPIHNSDGNLYRGGKLCGGDCDDRRFQPFSTTKKDCAIGVQHRPFLGLYPGTDVRSIL